MSASTKPLVLVDGSSYLFRAFHALPPLTNSQGEPTGAMHGVLNMLDRLRKDYSPEHMVVVFDAPGKTFRDDLYPEYKANRPSMPDELRSQIEPLLALIKAQGYPLVITPGVEADDVIGSYAEQYTGKVVISTSDKDMAQLVNDRVHLINTMSNTYMDEAGVREKFGVAPNRIRDYLALIGDTVDNVPGVEKVGPKTAVKWLTKYDSLEEIMTNADDFGGKIGENLRAALAHLPLSYELVTIKCDLPVELTDELMSLQAQDKSELAALYQRYGFNTRLKALNHVEGGAATNKEELADVPGLEVDYETILDRARLDFWLERLQKAPLFAFDTETTSLDYMQADLVGVSFSVKSGEAAYVPFGHDYIGAPKQLGQDEVLDAITPLLENEQKIKIGQNLKYDASVLARIGITLRGIGHDTMLQSYTLDSTASRHDMDSLCQRHLNHQTIHFEDIAGKGKNQLTFNQIDLEQAGPYAAEDADVVLRLHEVFWPKLQSQAGQLDLYENIEMPLVSVLSRLERNGVKVDATQLLAQSAVMESRLGELVEEAYSVAGEEFNLSSPKQIQAIFFDKLGLPVIRKTPKGQPSTAEDVLEELADLGHDLPKLILEHRGLSKLKSTYTDKLPQQINPDTNRIHTSYHQAVTATGRLSSSDPNLQNIPVRTAAGRQIRQAFIPEPGNVMVAADYSQIELRIMAHLSGDKGLLAAFLEGKDVHSATASEVFGVPLEAVETDQRRAAKAINFGLIYGMSAFGLAKQLNVTRSDAQYYVDLYFNRYPGVKAYMDRIREQAHDQGFVETIYGRRLYLPEIKSRQAARRQYAERTAINAPMQGSAADIIKQAMIAVDEWILSDAPPVKMIMQVHDELVFEIAEDSVDRYLPMIQTLMNGVAQLDVPMLVDCGVGRNWDEAH